MSRPRAPNKVQNYSASVSRQDSVRAAHVPFFLACSLCTGQDVELLPWRTVETRPLALQHGRLPCCKGLGFRASACVAWVWFHVCPLHGFTWVRHRRCRSALRHCVQRGSAGGSALLDAPEGDTHWRQLKVELGWARRIVRGSVLFGAGCSSRCGMPTIKLRLQAAGWLCATRCSFARPFGPSRNWWQCMAVARWV